MCFLLKATKRQDQLIDISAAAKTSTFESHIRHLLVQK
jgi:hypothetical protein